MADISYVRAVVSCLPIVGPFVGLYNAFEVNQEMSSDPLVGSLNRLQTRLIGIQGVLSALEGQTNETEKAQQKLETQRIECQNKPLLASQKGRLYAICGVAGNVLSVATIVGLIAFGIFSVAPGVIAIIAFTFQAAVLSYNLHQHNKIIIALQTA